MWYCACHTSAQQMIAITVYSLHLSRHFLISATFLKVSFNHNWSLTYCKYRALLLLLSRFSRVRLCATPETAAHQAPPSLGFSRQEHWNGLPFPSPTHESEKWKWSHVRLFATLWTAAHQAPPSMGFSRQEYWSGVPSPSPTEHYTYQ